MNWIQKWELKRLFNHQTILEKWIVNDRERLKHYQKRLRQINKQIKEALK